MAIETAVRTHTLKTDPDVFDAVASGQKTFEIRWNDRGYQVGDVLFLRKTRYTGAQMIEGMPLEYIGAPIRVTVTYVLHGPVYGLEHGWVIMGISAAAPRPEAGQQACTICHGQTGYEDDELYGDQAIGRRWVDCDHCKGDGAEPQQSVRRPVPTCERPPFIIDVGFRYENGIHTPTVLLGFSVCDWDSRDEFVRNSGFVRPAEPDGGAV